MDEEGIISEIDVIGVTKYLLYTKFGLLGSLRPPAVNEVNG